jgi:hypothetical protein
MNQALAATLSTRRIPKSIRRARKRRPSGATGSPCGSVRAMAIGAPPSTCTPGGNGQPGGAWVGFAGAGTGGAEAGRCGGGALPYGGAPGAGAGRGGIFGDGGAFAAGGGPGGGTASAGSGSPIQPSPSQYRWVVGSAGSLYQPGSISLTAVLRCAPDVRESCSH